MAIQETRTLPAPFIDKLGTDLATQITAQAQIPVVAPGTGGISQLAGESAADFAKRQQAAEQFAIREQSLAGLAPEVAGLSQLEKDARTAAQAGIGSFAPFVQAAQTQAGTAGGILGQAGTTLGGVPLGAQAFQQDVSQFMSPYQSQVIDASLAEFDRNTAMREQSIRDQQAALGALGSGRAGVQLAEFGTGAARERALLQANLLQQGFQQAQGARQQDIANRFGLGQAFAGTAGQRAGLAGQRAGLAGAQLGQAQFQTGLASLVPGLQRADVGQLGALGAIDRSLSQAQLDAQRQAATQAAFQPQQQLDRYAAQVTGLMGGYPGGTRQEFIPQPTPLQSALGIATTLGGLYLGSR